MDVHSPELFAVIHIGSEQVSLQVVEYQGLSGIRIVEEAYKQVMLGEETFKTGKISFATVNELCELLKGYRRLLNEYGVKEYRLVATTAIREAENQPYIIDQIKIKTGFHVEVTDMPQEIFYKYVAIFKAVEEAGFVQGPEGILFVDTSSGGLGFTLYQEHKIKYQQNIHIGALRIKESFDKSQRDSNHFQQALAEYIYSTIEPVEQVLGQFKIKYMVLSGTETKLLLKMLGCEQVQKLSVVSLADFYNLYDQVRSLNLPQLVKKFAISEQTAEMVLPTIVLYSQILSLASGEEIIMPDIHFVDGITTLYVAAKTEDSYLAVIEDQIVSLAYSLGCKYNHDVNHAIAVKKTALILFDHMIKVHGLGKRERLLLKVASILHDIGKYVSLRKHYVYSYRLITSSDMLGFSEQEKRIMATVARYHSKGTPTDGDEVFSGLTPEQRVTVAKLIAIIRLSDAIDRSHRQKNVIEEVLLQEDELIITVAAKEDISLEEWTFADKTPFFEKVFGIRPVLVRKGEA